ncbi:MAG: LptF/LptG family permease, partial [Gemmatimonadetes bacterium]|nr:LptF/LptG family permease [Gemmatimonadota bacterium]
MRILTRYLLRLHVAPFVFALSVLTSLLFINTVARRFGDLAGKGLGLGVILEVMALSLPHILALTLPMAVLVAVLYTFSQLTADNEITALKASGTNLLRILAPLIVAAVVLAAFMVYFNDRILPEMNHSLKNLMSDIGRKSPTLTLDEQIINPIRPTHDLRTQYFLQAAEIEPATNRLADVVIYDLSLGQKIRTVYADSGRMDWNREQTNLLLTLYDGVVYEVDTYQPKDFQKVEFTTQMQVLEGVGDELTRVDESYRSDREMSLAMLSARVDTARAQRDSLLQEAARRNQFAVRQALAGPRNLSAEDPTPQLPPSLGSARYIEVTQPGDRGSEFDADDRIIRRTSLELSVFRNQARAREQDANRFAVEYHKKFAIPVACIVFVLVGAPLAVRFPRGGAGMVIAISLGIFGIYYMSLIGGESLGDRGVI